MDSDMHLMADIIAVRDAHRGADIPGRENAPVTNDDRPRTATITGSPASDLIHNIEKILVP